MQVAKIIIIVCTVIGTTLTLLQAYKYLFYIGFLKKPKYKKTENTHTYGICVCCRNEEKVIRNFLESIELQDYPIDKLTVFIVADNCTDNTVDIVKEFAKNSKVKIVCYEHKNERERTKGFALKFLFGKIKEDLSISCCDGYFIFDADNILNADYMARMNEAFDAGNKIVVSFRNSKNFNQNWISYSYATHWLRTCLFESRGKSILHLSCRIQGTGYLFSSELVADGWNTTSLTEDRYFCTDAVIRGYRVAYCEDAVFYDEQPHNLKIALRQRLRWAKGNLQSTVKNSPKLLKKMAKFDKWFFVCYDSFWLNFPYPIESIIRRLIKWCFQIVVGILAYKATQAGAEEIKRVLIGVLASWASGYAYIWKEQMIIALVTCIFYEDRIPKLNIFKRLFYIIMFPFFSVIGKWATYVALFKKVEWKPVPHDYAVNVKEFTGKKE